MMSPLSKSKFNLVACIIAALLLAFLFIFPHKLAVSVRNSVNSDIEHLITAVKHKEWDAANIYMHGIIKQYKTHADTMKLFLNHEDLDMLEAAVYGSQRLVEQQEDKQLLVELEHIRSIVTYLAEIETFSLYNLF